MVDDHGWPTTYLLRLGNVGRRDDACQLLAASLPGVPAPRFSLKAVTGPDVELERLRGKKIDLQPFESRSRLIAVHASGLLNGVLNSARR